MSQSRSKASPATPAEPYTKLPSAAPKIEPTNVLPTGIAFSFSQVLPGLVTTLLLSRFKDVVADPVATLTSLLLPLSTLQVAYCVLCLPPHQNAPTPSSSTQNQPSAGGSVNSNPARKKTGNGHTKLSSLPSRIIPALLSLALTLLLTFPALTVLIILQGGPLTTHHLQTLLLALHIALLTTPPLFYTQGVSSERWRSLVSLSAAVDETRGAAMGTLVGAWLGAIPIPLDWDREWQKWPVTVVAGAYAGWVVGKVLGGTLLKGKFVDFN